MSQCDECNCKEGEGHNEQLCMIIEILNKMNERLKDIENRV